MQAIIIRSCGMSADQYIKNTLLTKQAAVSKPKYCCVANPSYHECSFIYLFIIPLAAILQCKI